MLLVDQVDDTRTTLKYCIDELRKRNDPKEIAVMVVHNKVKKKEAELSNDVRYYAGEDVPDRWICYPWDAGAYKHSIDVHESIARECRRDSTNNDSIGANRMGKRNARKERLTIPLYYVLVILALGLLMIFSLYSRNLKLQKVIGRKQQDSMIRNMVGRKSASSKLGVRHSAAYKSGHRSASSRK